MSYLSSVQGYGIGYCSTRTSPYKDSIKDLYRKGMSQGKIAEELGVSKNICYKYSPADAVTKDLFKHLFYLGHTVEQIAADRGFEYTSRITEAIKLTNVEDTHNIIIDYINGGTQMSIDRRGLGDANYFRVLNAVRNTYYDEITYRNPELKQKILDLHSYKVNNSAYIGKELKVPAIVVHKVLSDNGRVSKSCRDTDKKLVW